MKKIILTGFIFLFLTMSAFAYHGVTHGGTTNIVEMQNNILKKYLENLGFKNGRGTPFTINLSNKYWWPITGTDRHILTSLQDGKKPLENYYGEDKNPFNFSYPTYTATYSALDWLIVGSILEDVQLFNRAVHHFHDPTTLLGLSDLLSGTSARTRAFDDTTMDFRWSADDQHANVRLYQYKALTAQTEEERSHWWALTLFGVGSLVHLLEDMGVPEHVRNDFSYGHVRLESVG